jgi:hypothetical protein
MRINNEQLDTFEKLTKKGRRELPGAGAPPEVQEER